MVIRDEDATTEMSESVDFDGLYAHVHHKACLSSRVSQF